MLSAAHAHHERGVVQGMNDMIVFGMVTVASLASGGLMNCSGGTAVEGWDAVNLAMVPFLILAGWRVDLAPQAAQVSLAARLAAAKRLTERAKLQRAVHHPLRICNRTLERCFCKETRKRHILGHSPARHVAARPRCANSRTPSDVPSINGLRPRLPAQGSPAENSRHQRHRQNRARRSSSAPSNRAAVHTNARVVASIYSSKCA